MSVIEGTTVLKFQTSGEKVGKMLMNQRIWIIEGWQGQTSFWSKVNRVAVSKQYNSMQ
ncbi:MAG: hypothetical protein ACRES5_10570 [Pseudomonas sp.]